MHHLASVISTSINQLINQSLFVKDLITSKDIYKRFAQSNTDRNSRFPRAVCQKNSVSYLFLFFIVHVHRHAENSAAVGGGGGAATKRSAPALTLR